MSYFAVPETWEVPDYVWRQSFEEMAVDGTRNREGVAMWLGVSDGRRVRATQVVVLRGHGVTKRPDHLHISSDLVNVVTDLAITHNLILVGQIHSHSPLGTTDLSIPDRYLGIAVPGYLSLVAPDFALRPNTRIGDCGVHVHEGQTGWRRLTMPEIAKRFILSGLAQVTPLTAESMS